jgi:5-methyltetrahydropteroyltriglutamate--homocysteine methyltransferase
LTYQGWAYLTDFPGGSHRDLHIEALNHAVRDIPADRMRLHLCFSNYDGPHNHDASITDLMPFLFKAKPQGLAFEAANPRHAHEWQAWQEADIPQDKILIPGIIESTNNFIEHPELISQRLINFAKAVGRERVIAGTDCGFATFVGGSGTHPSIAWAKLKSLAEGAELASKKLWP